MAEGARIEIPCPGVCSGLMMMMIRVQQCSVVAAGDRNDLQISSCGQYLVLHFGTHCTRGSVVPCDSNSCGCKKNLGPPKKFTFDLLAVLP